MSTRPWVMHQSWYDFLVLHWAVDPAAVRPLVAPELELDLWEGRAWVGVIPFRMEHVRPRFSPDLPGISSFLELNVRTYARLGDRTGVHFLSLECNHRAAVEVARAWYDLPYFRARMSSVAEGGEVRYRSERLDPRGPPARYEGRHRPVGEPAPATAGTLEHWLIERYALFTASRGRAFIGDVDHTPWPVSRVEVELETQTLLASHGLAVDERHPTHAMWSPGVDTRVWAPRAT